jgi:hypothetical protein
MSYLINFFDTNCIFIFAGNNKHESFLEGSGAVLDGLIIFEGEFFSLENDFGFIFVVNLPFHGFDKVLIWSSGFDFVGDDLIGEILNLNGCMKLLFRVVIELDEIGDFAQLLFGLH